VTPRPRDAPADAALPRDAATSGACYHAPVTRPRLTLLGGGLEVGANAFLLDLDGARLLLDAGTHPRQDGAVALPRFDLAGEIDDVVVTHGHMDHVGALPVLLRRHPRARIWWSRSTEVVTLRQLHASVSVMRREAEAGGPEPLFGHDAVEELTWRGWALEAGDAPRSTGHGRVRLEGFHTGHLLGALGVVVERPGFRLVYTGDFCGHDRELQPAVEPPPGPCDVLIVEGTYGATPEFDGSGYDAEVERFANDVETVLLRGGSVLVPAFALGRTQEMLAMLRRLMARRMIPRVPVWISGLGRAMSEVHDTCRNDPGMYRRRWRLARWPRVLEASDLDRLPTLLERPSIYLVTSGMMVAGTLSARLAERMVGDARHAVFFVGYVDPEEAGHRVLHARPGDWIEFQRQRPMTRVETADIRRYYFSAHADRRSILELVERLDPGHVVFVHGDPPALEWLAGQVAPRRRVSVPATGSAIEL
jgi:cleavage and polyadenylation specificity factor subunit 3